jgi:hypothetical protein
MADRKIIASASHQESITVGVPTALRLNSPDGRFCAVFDDNGETGYFYALDYSVVEQPIIDALHIYNCADVAHKEEPIRVNIIWSADCEKVALFINSYPHAAYNFFERRGTCRTGFPPADPNTTKFSHDWDEHQLEHFLSPK